MSEIGRMVVQLRLRPARIQRAAETTVDSAIAELNRAMVMNDDERERIAEALRALARE